MNYIEKIFKRTTWLSILESVVFAILGCILFFKPEGTIKVISYILGTIFILIGIYKMIHYLSAKEKYRFYNYDLVYGLMAIIIGLITIIYSNTISSIFRIMLGIWIAYTSFIRINLSLELKRVKSSAWIYSFLLALILLIAGLYIIMNSGAVIATVGIVMVVSSIIDIIENIIFMKNFKDSF